MPLIPCSIGQVISKEKLKDNIKYNWLNVYQQLMLMWPCGKQTVSRYSRDTFQDDKFDHYTNANLRTTSTFSSSLIEDSVSGPYCCTPWVSRSIERVDIDRPHVFVGTCSRNVVYEFELDVIQEGYDIMNEEGEDDKTIITSSVTLSKSDMKDKATLQQKIGAELESQLIVIENAKSLYWDEFQELSDSQDVIERQKLSCRVGLENVD